MHTNHGTCADYCASQGLVCRHAQDNGHNCELNHDHFEEKDSAQNGCRQSWGGQVCGCGPLVHPVDAVSCLHLDPASYDSVCSDAMEWHESIDMSTYAAEEVCNGKCSSLFDLTGSKI